jgi:hypothetical protein
VATPFVRDTVQSSANGRDLSAGGSLSFTDRPYRRG